MIPMVAEYLNVHDRIDAQTTKEVTGKSKATATRYLQRLVELDILRKKVTLSGRD